jgi:Lon protease-like protein
VSLMLPHWNLPLNIFEPRYLNDGRRCDEAGNIA